MNFDQGDVVLVRYPFSNQVDYKIRPAMVVSNNNFNRLFEAWVCPISTKNFEGYIEVTDFINSGKFEKPSFVKTSSIANLDQDLILKKIGSIKTNKVNEIVNKIIANF